MATDVDSDIITMMIQFNLGHKQQADQFCHTWNASNENANSNLGIKGVVHNNN